MKGDGNSLILEMYSSTVDLWENIQRNISLPLLNWINFPLLKIAKKHAAAATRAVKGCVVLSALTAFTPLSLQAVLERARESL